MSAMAADVRRGGISKQRELQIISNSWSTITSILQSLYLFLEKERGSLHVRSWYIVIMEIAADYEGCTGGLES